MSISLLATKLYIPPMRPNAVERPRLTGKLLSLLDLPSSFALISGPAGFGKTTLLGEFVSRLRQPVAWVSLDEGDDDPVRFWTYLTTACRSVVEAVGESALELLSTQRPLPDDTVPALLINNIAAQAQPLVLILDDVHAIQHSSIHAGLQFLLDHLPHNLHLIVSTRIDPPWALARFRASNQLVEIRARDLRFRMEEAVEFLEGTMGLNLAAEQTAALEERTEGWIAGLQLAALSMQGRSDIPAFVEAFTGSNLYVAEYLLEEVLQRQSEDVRAFLLQTSLLKRMNAGLCEAVTGLQDGQATLLSLQRANAFLVSLDNEARWFRYHHLFSDLLQARLRRVFLKDEIAALHRRASAWYEQNGYAVEAVNHALAAGDLDRVAGLVERFARAFIFSGQVSVLRDWLEALPDTAFTAHPHLVFYRFWIDVLTNQADLSEPAIREVEDLLEAQPSSPENDRLRGELMSVVCRAIGLSGRTSEGIRLAQEALSYLPPDDLASRARANSALATAHDLEGRAEEAGHAYEQSLSQAIAAGEYRLAAHTLMLQGLIQFHYGHLRESAGIFQKIIGMGERVKSAPASQVESTFVRNTRANKTFFPAGQGLIGLGCVYLEWNDLQKAEDSLKQGIELCWRGGLDGAFIGRVRLSRLAQARGDLDGALREIQLPQLASQRIDDFNIITRQIEIGLAKGDIDGATQKAALLAGILVSDRVDAQPPLLFLESIEAVVARVYIAQGEIEKALQLLDRLQSTAEPGNRLARLIEVHLLQALAFQKQNDGNLTSQAVENIVQALELAEPQGYVLLFLEEGTALVPLLEAVLVQRTVSDSIKAYAHRLLDAFGETAEPADSPPPGESPGLVEPLTPREMEVLELLAAGDSNQAIADKLFITVRTVKKHNSNIYGKLNADNRTQAVAKARELGLLAAG